MAWVQRDENGAIKGIYARRQAGYADEELPDDHVDVEAFKNRRVGRKPAPGRADRALASAFKALVDKGLITKAELPKEVADLLPP